MTTCHLNGKTVIQENGQATEQNYGLFQSLAVIRNTSKQQFFMKNVFLGTAKLLSLLPWHKSLRQRAYLERACIVPILNVHFINLHDDPRIRGLFESNQIANKASQLCTLNTTAKLRKPYPENGRVARCNLLNCPKCLFPARHESVSSQLGSIMKIRNMMASKISPPPPPPPAEPR